MDQQQEPNFQDVITETMMDCEELRQQIKNTNAKITTDILLSGREDLDILFENLAGMNHQLHSAGHTASISTDELQMQKDLFSHCQLKVAQITQLFLERILASPEPAEDDSKQPDDENEQQSKQQQLEVERRDFQASLARITELNLILCLETAGAGGEAQKKVKEIIEQYVAYQRQVLRERSKPSIARLVQERRDKASNPLVEMLPHSHVVTVILGQASALIHPLLAWMFSLPPPPPEGQPEENKLVEAIRQLCGDSVHVLDEQAQTLTKTVSDWFWEDRNVDDWMAKSNSEDSLMAEEKDHKYYLGELDGLVEEMAFVCQVLARYQALVEGFPKGQLQTIIEQELSPEWTWKYASLERFLATQQWKSALMLATPVHIVLGTSIQVPSVVEDAQYLSTRALERAASTRSTQAIGTVAHSVSSHVWSTDIHGGIHQALSDQIGCYVDESSVSKPKVEEPLRTSASTNSFASALLDALDDDIGKDSTSSSSINKKPARPPSSGPSSAGLLSSFVGGGGDGFQQIRINTVFCTLNGIHSASTACRSLVKFLDGLLENPETSDNPEEGQSAQQTNAMIQLAREELSHYGAAYDSMLKDQVKHVIREWCGDLHDPPKRKKGPCIPLLRNYFLNEIFELDSPAFNQAESDSRLEQELLGPLHESKFLQQLGDKCDAEVLFSIREELTLVLVELMLDCLLHSDPPKRFTDWGSLLLSKQVRLLQSFLSSLQDNSSSRDESQARHSKVSYEAWERLSQIATVLQLERPSDWILYQSTSVLTPDELRSAMHLRVDFSAEAINAVVGSTNRDTTAKARDGS
jgi:hypothetical protein